MGWCQGSPVSEVWETGRDCKRLETTGMYSMFIPHTTLHSFFPPRRHLFSHAILHSTRLRNKPPDQSPLPIRNCLVSHHLLFHLSHYERISSYCHAHFYLQLLSANFRFACLSKFAFHQRHGPFSVHWILNASTYKPTLNTHIDLQTHTGASINVCKNESISHWSTWIVSQKNDNAETSPTDKNIGRIGRLVHGEIMMIINHRPTLGRQLYQGLAQYVKLSELT